MMTPTAQSQSASSRGDQGLVAAVPRINIHAFCESQQTAETFQLAAADRRMSRAHCSVQLGGIMAAVQVFQAQATPNVLVVESRSPREQVMAELASLAEVCQPDTKVVVVGHLNDVVLYRELIRQGVSEYLIAPLQPFQLIESIASLYHNPKAAPLGRVFAFVGAKGGVGSSTLAHNIGWLMSKKLDAETVITDLDLAFGTAGLNFNQDVTNGVADALGQPDRVDPTLLERLLTRLGDKLSLLSGPGGVDRDFNIESHSIETILSALRSSVPNIIVDVPNMWAPWIKYTLLHADQVIITATPELASLRNARNLADLLKAGRPNDPPPKLILNQVGVPKRPEIPAADFSKAVGLEISAIIPHDATSFGTAQSNGQMVFEVAPKSKVVEAIAGFVELLAGTDKPAKKPVRSGLLSKLPLLGRK
ncbi:CpaE family protein [Aestuariivirga sp.]|uniref:AAA family ATPase n=1 Tax=Aestuariivirga sp. TaxID=2650926 RepID=UPI00391D6AE6